MQPLAREKAPAIRGGGDCEFQALPVQGLVADDPVASMQAIDNPDLAETAKIVREMLRHIVQEIGAEKK